MPSAFLFFFFFFLDDPFRKRRSTPLHESPVQGGPVIDPSLRTLLCGFFFPFWGFELPELRLRLRGPLRERETPLGGERHGNARTSSRPLRLPGDDAGKTATTTPTTTTTTTTTMADGRTEGRRRPWIATGLVLPRRRITRFGIHLHGRITCCTATQKNKTGFFCAPKHNDEEGKKTNVHQRSKKKKRTRPKLLHRVLERIDLVLYLQVQFIIDTKLNFGLIGFISTS